MGPRCGVCLCPKTGHSSICLHKPAPQTSRTDCLARSFCCATTPRRTYPHLGSRTFQCHAVCFLVCSPSTCCPPRRFQLRTTGPTRCCCWVGCWRRIPCRGFFRRFRILYGSRGWARALGWSPASWSSLALPCLYLLRRWLTMLFLSYFSQVEEGTWEAWTRQDAWFLTLFLS